MSVIAYVIVLAASGLLVGAIARLALPGADPMTLPETMLVGMAGSFSAGLIARVLFGSPGAGILLSRSRPWKALVRLRRPERPRPGAVRRIVRTCCKGLVVLVARGPDLLVRTPLVTSFGLLC